MSTELNIKDGRRKAFAIKYVEVTEENFRAVADWCGGVAGGEGKDRFVRVIDKNAMNQRQTKAFLGDFMLWSEETRSYKAFSRKSFNKAFERLEHVEHDRSSVTGKYVSEAEAEAHPETTVHETDEAVIVTPDGVDPKSLGMTELPRDADPS